MPDAIPSAAASPNVTAALASARAALAGARAPARASSIEHRIAIGDPQAPIERFFAVLERHQLLSSDGWLRPGVQLTSVGDHFDYGPFEARKQAGQSALELLAWLAAHEENQVTLICGNHDLSRVGELRGFDDDGFQHAARSAFAIYQDPARTPNAEAEFLARFPSLPSVEVAARDLSSFNVAQRELVASLLRARRFRLASAHGACLITHAGVTIEHLRELGVRGVEALNPARCAAALNDAFDGAIERWAANPADPFDIEHLHLAGSRERGEGGGVLFHRAAHPAIDAAVNAPTPSLFDRRFHPRRLPNLVQVVGHVRDAKCRSLLADWVVDRAGAEGRLRSLCVAGERVEYQSGARVEPAGATMLFIDGAMNTTPTAQYELLDLDEFAVHRPHAVP